MSIMTYKEMNYRAWIWLLTFGASLGLGLLSFAGMYVVWPWLPAAFLAVFLSVAYEGEIYLQNVRQAFEKLFSWLYIEQRVSKAFLKDHFPNLDDIDTPQFFRDYDIQVRRVHAFSHAHDKAGKKRYLKELKNLQALDRIFARRLLNDGTRKESLTPYQKELDDWLAKKANAVLDAKNQKASFTKSIARVKIFSIFSGIFMTLGTSYLLMETFATIPVLAALSPAVAPLLIVPMSIVAGSAYAMLTLNAMSDMVLNATVQKWYQKIRSDLHGGLTLRSVGLATTAVFLALLAVSLTAFTAGTWWTVVQETPPVFKWMRNIPSVVMKVIHPIIIAISAIVFNLENTGESLEMIEGAIDKMSKQKESAFTRGLHAITEYYQKLRQKESLAQVFNPFRITLKLTFLPLRVIFFAGHLFSIGVTTDRVPGVPKWLSILLNFLSEGFEDTRYFYHPEEEHHGDPRLAHLTAAHGHSHDSDLPTRLLKGFFIPMYVGATLWDAVFSHFGNKPLSLQAAWHKQWGHQHPFCSHETVDKLSENGFKEIALEEIEHHCEAQLAPAWIGQNKANAKLEQLASFKSSLAQASGQTLKPLIATEASKRQYGEHRFFASSGTTATQDLFEDLKGRILDDTMPLESCKVS